MLKDLFLKRQSCRNFDKERAVEEDKLVRIMENALLAPSACNSQPYSFVVARDEAVAAKVAETTQKLGLNRHCSNARAFVVAVEENAGLKATTAGRVEDQQFSLIDLGLAVSQLILSAEEEGLATCMIGWFDEKKLKDILGINKNKRIRLVVAIGYAAADDAIRKKKRKAFADAVVFR